MWYALTSKPLAASLTAALLANATVMGAGWVLQSPPAHPTTFRPVVLHPPKPAAIHIQVHLIPARPPRTFSGVPAAFEQPMVLPLRYRLSEQGALHYIARSLHVPLTFTGPDYALLGEHLPYGKPTPAIQLLTRIANLSYIEGQFTVAASGAIVVHNDPLDG